MFQITLKTCKRSSEPYPVMLNYLDHVRAILGPCLEDFAAFWTMFGLALLPDQPELWNFQDWLNMVLETCLWSAYFLGPCLDHIGTMIGLTLLPYQLELCNFEDWINIVQSICLSSFHLFGSCPDHLWPYWDHVCPNLISRPHADLKFWRMSHYDQELMSMEWLLFETMSTLLGHARTMITLVLLRDQLKHLNFQDWVNMV